LHDGEKKMKEEMLLNDFLPTYEFNEIHTVTIQAPPERVFWAIKELTASELSPLVFWMLNLRNLPGKLLGRKNPEIPNAAPFLDQLYEGGFIPLGDQPDRETVFGLIGQFWKLTGGEEPPISDSQAFLSFDDPAYAKVAANLLVEPVDGNNISHCSTETRIHVAHPQTRRKFAFYWRLISLGSGWIRILWLRAIKRKAETAPV